MKHLRLYIILFFSALTLQLDAQDSQFSQFYSNPLYLAPSFAGAVDGSRVATSYRRQWYDLSAPFHAYSFSYDHYFSTFNSGIGVMLLSDLMGSTQLGTTLASLMYSYNIKLFNVWHVRPGISFSYLQHGLHGGVQFIDDVIRTADNPSFSPTEQAIPFTRDIDAGASLLVYTYDLWFGATVDHLLEPNVSLFSDTSKVPFKTQVYGGWTFRKKGTLLRPSDETMTFAFLYKEQAGVKQLDLGVYWHSEPFVLGLWYRGLPLINSERGDAVVFLAGIKTHNFNIGYSYDLTISNLLPYTKGSHEISLAYKFLLPERKKRGAVPCPEF